MAFNFEYPYVDPTQYNADWLLKRMKELLAAMENMEEWRKEYEEAYEEYKAFIDELESGRLPEEVQDALTDWMRKNALSLVGELVKMVFFGLTPDGHFVAYIPEAWSDVLFGTSGYDDFPPGIDFGHLTLTY